MLRRRFVAFLKYVEENESLTKEGYYYSNNKNSWILKYPSGIKFKKKKIFLRLTKADFYYWYSKLNGFVEKKNCSDDDEIFLFNPLT